jgi:phage-related protein
MVYDIDIHQLNLGQLRNLKFLDEIPFKKCVFLHFFSNEFTILSSFQEKTTTISKRRFHKWALHYLSNFLLFGDVS